ncbi:MAG: diaminopimelate decarboxylase [Eubacteriales bacterium]|nr:diaminopimelate decarboxylase [Eubacteriales bacterium]MDD4475728.1 diaminopimelate decarboxylase [Eubacteriales bacterium]
MSEKLICKNLGINEKGHLTLAGVDTVSMAEKYGTPLYLLDENLIRERCRLYISSMKKHFGENSAPLYASKALSFAYIYKIMLEEGMGIDVVSSGELYTAMKAGFPASKAYFHGNNKTDTDIWFAMDNGISFFVVDNEEELSVIDTAAKERGIKQKILLRITPGIDPHTFKAVVTGNVDSKFGAAVETSQAFDITKLALTKENLILEGFHCHIGSQIFEKEPFCDAADIMLKFLSDVKIQLGFETKVLNLGGGIGVRYTPEQPEIDYDAYLGEISTHIRHLCDKHNIKLPQVLMEPGRSIVADSGLTLYTAGSVKHITGYKSYVSVDGGMTDNPRYALYQSPYTVIVANKADMPETLKCTIAGRCCESGDLIQEDVAIQDVKRGNIIAVLTTGAYNYSMASNYNRLPKPPIVMLRDGVDKTAVERETYNDVMKNDIL